MDLWVPISLTPFLHSHLKYGHGIYGASISRMRELLLNIFLEDQQPSYCTRTKKYKSEIAEDHANV